MRHPDTTFHHTDISSWEFTRKLDSISAWDSIWHLEYDQYPELHLYIIAQRT
jgi:hypothetical protein